MSVLDVTPLSDDHEIKFLQAARLEFMSERPPFVRRNKNEGPKVVTLAVGSGQLPKTAILATLVTRKWHTKNSFYTLDRNGERLTVKPFGGMSVHKDRGGNPYRTWSGQGNVFGESPIAFAFKGDTDEQPSNRKDVGAGLESTFGEFSIQGSDYREEEGYSSTTFEASGLESEAHRGSKSQEAKIDPAFPEISATQGRLARLNTHRDNPSPSESSTAAPQQLLLRSQKSLLESALLATPSTMIVLRREFIRSVRTPLSILPPPREFPNSCITQARAYNLARPASGL